MSKGHRLNSAIIKLMAFFHLTFIGGSRTFQKFPSLTNKVLTMPENEVTMEKNAYDDHVLHSEGFEREGCDYTYNGLSLSSVISRVETPSYIYFLDILARKIQELRDFSTSINGSGTDIFYSVKANPATQILTAILESGLNVEVSSMGELDHVLKTGFNPERIILLGPGKEEDLIRRASEMHIRGIIAESFRELELISKYYDGNMVVLVRLNMEDETSKALESMSGSESKFGIDVKNLEEIVRRSRFVPEGKFGFQYYLGSQVLDYKESLRLHEKMLSYMQRFRERVDYIDLGGGFGVPMTPKDLKFDFGSFSSGLNRILRDNGLDGKKIWFESGRFLVADCGLFVTRIVDIKTAGNGGTMLTTDGGMNNFFRIAFLGADHPIRAIGSGTTFTLKPATVCGPLCTPIDCFGKNILIPDCVREGDTVLIFKAGAYGLSLSPVLFLLQKVPGEYAVKNNKLGGSNHPPIGAETVLSFIYARDGSELH